MSDTTQSDTVTDDVEVDAVELEEDATDDEGTDATLRRDRRAMATLPDGRWYRPSKADHARSLEPSDGAKLATWLVLVLVLLYFLFPLYWLIVSATKTNAQLSEGSLGLSEDPLSTMKANYNALMAWTDGMFWRWVANSVFYSTVAGVIGTLQVQVPGGQRPPARGPGRTAPADCAADDPPVHCDALPGFDRHHLVYYHSQLREPVRRLPGTHVRCDVSA